MEFRDLEIVLLHKNPQYMKHCCQLLNEEWPRSDTARMLSLQLSCDTLPTSLILLRQNTVIGHCKLTAIPSIRDSCFLESVVISKQLRGRKLGTFLMSKAEEYCKDILQLTTVHLSTKGQENFYSKLGYEVCAPVSIYGNFVPNNYNQDIKDDFVSIKDCRNSTISTEKTVPASPPPPPPPIPKFNLQNSNNVKTNKIYMFKYL